MGELRNHDTSVATPPDLIAEDLGCRRGARRIFAGLSFRLSAGGALVLTGSNGSGKTSLLRIIAGLAAPSAGRLVWGGAPVAADLAQHRANLHYVGHQDAIKPVLTVRETLSFWAALRGFSSARTGGAVDRSLAAFGLEAAADWPCRWLSAGQRRRLALARLLAAPAPLWLLDEPLGGLDADGSRRLAAIVAAHRAGGGRIVLSTHTPFDLEAAQSLTLDAFASARGAVD